MAKIVTLNTTRSGRIVVFFQGRTGHGAFSRTAAPAPALPSPCPQRRVLPGGSFQTEQRMPLKKTPQDFTLQNENFHCFILDCGCLQKYSCEYTNVPIEAKYFYFLIFNKLSQDS